MCDRDESWANLNTYQTCLNYRGKMRYKNYGIKEKNNLETVHSIHHRKCLTPTIHKAGSSWGSTDGHLPESIAEIELVMSSTEKRRKASLGL